ncbi:ABC-type cobalt transport system ATPase component [Candidatus Brocadia sinica JPN1]|uniref:ABC-type cobalt transport system ATPase component n=1 Tax=Candidatus Brocadia sinica JPN1 TaxID=1197129 RepID=A0ABQ0JW76_9BACT|nr:ABC-type cobalt transport system ATPase component [Candidatus Brocadia sinica JPN1]
MHVAVDCRSLLGGGSCLACYHFPNAFETPQKRTGNKILVSSEKYFGNFGKNIFAGTM